MKPPSPSMVLASTEIEPPADKSTPQSFSGWPTGPYRVELSLSLDTEGSPKSCRLLIEGLTFEDAIGIYQVASARFYATAGRARSNGG